MLKFIRFPGVVLGLLLLSGCDTMGPDLFNKLPLEPVSAIKEPGQEDPSLGEIDGQSPSEEGEKPTSEYYTGTGRFVRPGVRPGGPARAPRHGKYTLNFDDADLGEVAKVILSDTLNVNYVLSPQVAGTVNLQTSHPLTREELIPTLEMVLRMNGAVLLRDGNLYRIEPESNALQSAQSPRLGRAGARIPIGYQVRIVPLRYVGVKEMHSILEPLLPPKAILRADPVRNLLLIAGTSDELENIIDTISIFDVDVLQGMSVGLFTLKNADVATVIAELETLFGEASEGPLAGMFRLLPIERLNAILVITPQPKYLYEAESWIERLDRTVTAAGGGVNVYRVQNMDAVELAGTLNEIFGGRGRSTPGASLAPGLTPREISGSQDGEPESAPPSRDTGNMTVSDVGKDVRIIADERNNALVIVATKHEYDIIARVIKELDVTPLQVLIDATIVEVTLKDSLEYGMQWFLKNTLPGDHTGRAILSENLQDIALALATGGFSYSIVNNANDVRFVLRALAEDQKINVIASPSLMVLDNQEATINVGDQVPIATSQSTNTSSATVIDGATNAIVTNQIQLVDTGVTLKIKPRVNAGGLVIMDIEQEANVPIETTTSGLDSPTIQQRKIQSSIAVQSGETIVLGGLIQDRRNHRRDGVPFFSKIPFIGPLFGSTEKQLDRTELVVLITPRVVRHKQDAREITLEFKRKLTGIYSDLPVSEEAQPNVDMDEAVN